MSETMCCLLCLEHINDLTTCTDIDSVEGRSHKVQETLEKYFPSEITDSISRSPTRLLCHRCWTAISTFHDFCARIKNAHLEATNLLQSTLHLELKPESIKLESEISEPKTKVSSPAPTRRKRGRPKRKAGKNSTQVDPITTPSVVLPACRVVLEKLDMTALNCKQEDESPVTVSSPVIMDIVKHEALLEECMDADYAADDTDSDYLPSGAGNINSLEPDSDAEMDSDELKSELNKKKKGRTLTSRSKKCREADEFIAANFKLTCCLCNIPMEDFTAVGKHFRDKHQTVGYVRCCGKKLLKRSRLVDHLMIHQNPDYFKCKQCGKVLADRFSYDMHRNNHEEGRARIYNCEHCPKSFFSDPLLKRHMLIHVPDEKKTFPCPECDKLFPTASVRNIHLKGVHLNLYAKMCDVCGKSIRGRKNLRIHMDEHRGIMKAPVECKICGAKLSHNSGLKRHIKSVHTDREKQTFTCPICGKLSPSEQAHKNHVRFVHTDERKYPCTMCEKKFKWSKHLKEHMTTHTGEVLYTCSFCPKTFNSNANMYSHRKKMHPKEWAAKMLEKPYRPHKNVITEQNATAQVPTTTKANSIETEFEEGVKMENFL